MSGSPRNLTKFELEEQLQQEIYLAMSVCLLVLMGGLFLASTLRKYKVLWFAEASALVVVGIIIGAIMKAASTDSGVVRGVVKLVEFDNNLFFIVLLPPIIFNSGLEVNQKTFFRNIGTICALAFLGTLLSALVVSVIMYEAGEAGVVYRTTKTEALTFGALISATDPVTVIAVFQSFAVRGDLLALVIGESILNDAVAIVLYNTVVSFESQTESIVWFTLEGILAFITVFVGSVAVGLLVGVASALTFKCCVQLGSIDFGAVEAGVAFLFPYVAYCLSEGLELSGIVTILFCGLTMSRYTQHNLSERGRQFLFSTYGAFAYIAESFIFIYLGLAVFTSEGKFLFVEWPFSLLSFAACLASRVVCVLPICIVSNCCRKKSLRAKEIFILWFSGLRGGIAYALAADSAGLPTNVIRTQTGYVFQEATTFVVILGLFLFGNTVLYVAQLLGVVDSNRNKAATNGHAQEVEMTLTRTSSLSQKLEFGVIRPMLLRRSFSEDTAIQQRPPQVDTSQTVGQDDGTTNIELSEARFEPLQASASEDTVART